MQSQFATNQHFGVETEHGYTGRHALVPVLIGLMGPVLVISLVDPRALASASVLVHIYLFAIFMIAAGAYIYSVLDPGEVTRVTFDKQAGFVSAERSGLFAMSTLDIPFSDISTVRIEARYDDDGYQTAIPVMVLKNRQIVPLPAGTTEADVAAMCAVLKNA